MSAPTGSGSELLKEWKLLSTVIARWGAGKKGDIGSSMIQYIVNVEGVIVQGDKILISRRGEGEEYLPGVLGIPGGKVEDAGNVQGVIEAALRREIEEEVGLMVKDEMIYLESKLFMMGEVPVIDLVFLCQYESGEARPVDLEEVAEVNWMTYAEVMAEPGLPPWIRQSIELAARKLGWS